MKRGSPGIIVSMLWLMCTSAVGAGCSSDKGSSVTAPPGATGFLLKSSDVSEGGALPSDYTCDGTGSTLPLLWTGVPAGTRSYAVIMHHVASPADVHWYWVLYNLPADITGLPKNVTGLGTLGNNSVNGRVEYAPPCSQGPGPKIYTYTVYALSAFPVIAVPDSLVSRAVLLEAMAGRILDSAALHVVYSRPPLN